MPIDLHRRCGVSHPFGCVGVRVLVVHIGGYLDGVGISERTWVAPGGPDLCGSEKFHELDLIVSLGLHPSLTPKAAFP